jgi:hypothetical protein
MTDAKRSTDGPPVGHSVQLIVGRVRELEIDHEPEGWPAVKMKMLSRMADEIERLNAALQQIASLRTDQTAAPDQCAAVVIAMDALFSSNDPAQAREKTDHGEQNG